MSSPWHLGRIGPPCSCVTSTKLGSCTAQNLLFWGVSSLPGLTPWPRPNHQQDTWVSKPDQGAMAGGGPVLGWKLSWPLAKKGGWKRHGGCPSCCCMPVCACNKEVFLTKVSFWSDPSIFLFIYICNLFTSEVPNWFTVTLNCILDSVTK